MASGVGVVSRVLGVTSWRMTISCKAALVFVKVLSCACLRLLVLVNIVFLAPCWDFQASKRV